MLFPGRTEYVEKYGPVASELTAAGLSVIAIDWRGQGLSDRLSDDPLLGHVGRFLDYQLDVAELIKQAHDLELPRPWFLIAHSMGGCIGYRALAEGLDVSRAVFSAPMWGIQMSTLMRPLAHVIPGLARVFGKSEDYAPGTSRTNYTASSDFKDNTLTSDPDTYAWLRHHALTVQEFSLGGPSIQWVGEAMVETVALARLPRPACPVRTYLGTEEAIVSPMAIQNLHAKWPNAKLVMMEGALHELMMERAPLRRQFLDETKAFFAEDASK